MFENDPADGKMTVRIAGLTKVYNNGTKAVRLEDRVDFNEFSAKWTVYAAL